MASVTPNPGSEVAVNFKVKQTSKEEKPKPPLLEYWKPPKAVVFAPKNVVNNSHGKDSEIPKREEDRNSRNQNLNSSLDIEKKEIPTEPVYIQYDTSISSPSNSISSETTASSSSFVVVSKTNSNNNSRQHKKRFTWADSTTKLIGIKDTDSTSLKSVPWGYDETSTSSSSWKSKTEKVRVTEREILPFPITPTSMMGAPPAYRLDAEDTLRPHWWQVQEWSRKRIIWVSLAAAVVLAIVIAVAVEVTKKNRYPDYSALNYTLVDQFSGTEFFNNFDYFDATDPTDGFVQYVNQQTAAQLNLTYASSSAAVLRVDTSNSNAVNGRQSVRITSKNTYDNGLFIFDVVHSPYGCATWPALWLSDVPNWPKHGEIDVMEQVNQGTAGNIMTLHTSNDCSMSVKRKETGSVRANNCYNGTDSNAGCGVTGPSSSYGEAFNKKGGGIMAMELRSAGIRMWQFLRDEIPSDITAQNPDPSTWGEALADFPNTDCDITSHFKNQTIIANIEICGDWAGATSVYSTEDQCPGTCTQYAQTNATAFETAYFEFGNFTIYQSSSLN